MRWVAALLLLLLPGMAWAQTFPALYDVTGVASDDVLNIRAEPSAATDVIGALGPSAKDVEVIRLDDGGAWGLVNSDERSGWVSMRYMVRQAEQQPGAFPAKLFCTGTEPFWNLNLRDDGTALFETPDSSQDYTVTQRVSASARPGDYAFVAEGPAGRATLVVTARACSDGMSDRAFGLSLSALFEGGGAPALYAGCCSLTR